MFDHVADDPDMEHLIVDSTVVRSHPCAAGAPQEQGGQDAQALGRSRGGFSTKIHVAVDGLDNPVRIILTGGQCGDAPQGAALIDGYHPDFVIGDKASDSDAFRQKIVDQGAEPVIPPKRNRTHPPDYDAHRYEERHLVECFINKIKQYRRIFSRFEKLSIRYLGFLQFASALIWLR